ncbi:MAG TPA: hypothetical protein VG984_00965 [Candidatus Paceibacterota bacterium]|nr:hypothetical protein [Candidatus Paceibacterota bacterium]
MSDIRMLGLVTSCGKCPNRRSDTCIPAGEQRIVDLDKIASFCPLSVYPARQMAGMEKTIDYVQKPLSDQPFGVVLLNYVAARLKVKIHPEGASLDIPLKDGNTVRLDLHRAHLKEDVFRLQIEFFDGRTQTYVLTIDRSIELKFKREGDGELFQILDIAL